MLEVLLPPWRLTPKVCCCGNSPSPSTLVPLTATVSLPLPLATEKNVPIFDLVTATFRPEVAAVPLRLTELLTFRASKLTVDTPDWELKTVSPAAIDALLVPKLFVPEPI